MSKDQCEIECGAYGAYCKCSDEAAAKSSRSPGCYGGSLTLLTYPDGECEVIDRAPDTWEIRECALKPVTLKMVDRWRERTAIAAAVAQILLEKQRTGDIPDLGAVNDYLKALAP